MRLIRRKQPTPDPDKEKLEQTARRLAEQRAENERRLRVLEAQSQVLRRQ